MDDQKIPIDNFRDLIQPVKSYLTANQRERITAFDRQLRNLGVDCGFTLKETFNNFQRDVHPEREIVVWEAITATIADIAKKYPTLIRQRIYRATLNFSVGEFDFKSQLEENTLDEIYDTFTRNMRAYEGRVCPAQPLDLQVRDGQHRHGTP